MRVVKIDNNEMTVQNTKTTVPHFFLSFSFLEIQLQLNLKTFFFQARLVPAKINFKNNTIAYLIMAFSI